MAVGNFYVPVWTVIGRDVQWIVMIKRRWLGIGEQKKKKCQSESSADYVIAFQKKSGKWTRMQGKVKKGVALGRDLIGSGWIFRYEHEERQRLRITGRNACDEYLPSTCPGIM